MSFFTGKPASFKQLPTFGKEAAPLYSQLQAATQGRGAGGAFGEAADYYRGLLSDNPADLQAMAAPEIRRYHEEFLPNLAHQYAGMGSGVYSSSGLAAAKSRGAVDLAERIASIRAGLRQQGAQGLMGLGQQGLGQYHENVQFERQPGLLEGLPQVLGPALSAVGGPALGQVGGYLGTKVADYLKPKNTKLTGYAKGP